MKSYWLQDFGFGAMVMLIKQDGKFMLEPCNYEIRFFREIDTN